MIGLRTKREVESVCPHLDDHIKSLKYQIRSLRSKEINRVELLEMLRLCESLRIDIQAKLV